MSHRVLILDDDNDFNVLLTDVYRQADYEVRSLISPVEALRVFAEESFDLVVTDQRMPELKGSEFVREIFRCRRDTPVIVISGFLDNETVRDLIQQGVGGIFVKPLNVFSLLKKTAELIARSHAGAPLPPGHGGTESSQGELASPHNLPFPFESLPCRCQAAEDFAKALYAQRNFRTNLVLLGEEGCDFSAVAEDLGRMRSEEAGKERILYCRGEDLEDPHFPDKVHSIAAEGVDSLLCVYEKIEELDPAVAPVILELSRKEDRFAELNLGIRNLYCLSQELDELYDEEKIDDTLYLFIGTNEVRIPALRDLPEEIVPLAERYLREAELGKATIPPPVATFLRDQPWPGNQAQLREVVTTAARCQPNAPLTRELVEDLYHGRKPNLTPQDLYAIPLRQFLEEVRSEYAGALLQLTEESAESLARQLPISQDAFPPGREIEVGAGQR